MKKVIAILLCLCEPSLGAIAVRNSIGATASPITVTSTTSGDLVVVGIGIVSTSVTVTKVCFDGTTCAAGNSFTQVPGARKAGSLNEVDFWYLANVGSGKTTVTITLSAGSIDSAGVWEISGAATSSVVDTVSAGTSGTNSNNTGVTVNNANSGSILITGEECSSAITAHTVFTEVATNPFPNSNSYSSDIPGDTTGHAPVYTSSCGDWSSAGASFCPAAGCVAATSPGCPSMKKLGVGCRL